MSNLLQCVKDTISYIHGVPYRLLWESKGRQRDVVLSRHTGIYVYYVASGESISQVARAFGMHHSSVLHALAKCDIYAERDTFYEKELRSLVTFCLAKTEKG